MIKLELLGKEEDLQKIVEWNVNKSSEYLLQWAGPKFDYPLTFEQMEKYFFKEIKKENSKILVYKILITGTEEMIGTVEIRETDKENKVGRICRFLIGEEKNRGRSIGTIALNEALKIAFQDMKFKKMTLGVFDFNYDAIRCYEKVAFVKEKFSENIRKSTTGYWSLYEMGISKLEWQRKKCCTDANDH